ncbi:PREDICTED: uncharacterized protein LOC109359768 [Lupinus angustifolius]|uniref:uncharacterized protein LOC109359768 n=1 Tax=Lupinus angustifolius TaxID=3871 RepID=UPI00092E29A6|nr:PREDICTED: uncharacterized protein LOC109359768 [Lupinus angustifolius]
MRLIVVLASWKNWTLWQLDVKSAFHNSPLEELAPRAWNKRIDKFLSNSVFMKCEVEYGMYTKTTNQNKDVLLIFLYVDDLLIIGSCSKGIEELKGSLKGEFEMTDLGRLAYFLCLEFQHIRRGLFMHQRKYLLEVLNKFNMINCNPSKTPAEMNLRLGNCEEEEVVDATVFRQIVGNLRYICHIRPEISFSVGVTSRFMSNPKKSHMLASKRVLRYLKGKMNFGIVFPHEDERIRPHLMAYSESDWCGDILDRKSTVGYVFIIAGAPISWCSKKQKVVAFSSCEAEYIAACSTAYQASWLSSVLMELGMK